MKHSPNLLSSRCNTDWLIPSEESKEARVSAVLLRGYITKIKDKSNRKIISESDVENMLECLLPDNIVPSKPQKIERKKPRSDLITKIKSSSALRKSFLVADIETNLIENKHVPYAAGVMEVEPGKDLPSIDEITWWYSEDLFNVESFAERSKNMLNSFLRYIEFLVRKNK